MDLSPTRGLGPEGCCQGTTYPGSSSFRLMLNTVRTIACLRFVFSVVPLCVSQLMKILTQPLSFYLPMAIVSMRSTGTSFFAIPRSPFPGIIHPELGNLNALEEIALGQNRLQGKLCRP